MNHLQTLQADPSAFRSALRIDADGHAVPFGSIIEPWQDQDFTALDPAWRKIVGHNGNVPHSRAWLERPRGHSKTTDIAVMVTWALFASRRSLRGIVAAADKDQAALIRDAIRRIVMLNPWLGKILDVLQWKVINKHTESSLTIISSDVASSYGQLVDFIVCDELCHWSKPELWESLFSTAAKRASCLLVVITNAGWTESWQWPLREAARTRPEWYFNRLDGPSAKWITQDRLDEQRALLPQIAFDRLWLNQWSAGAGDALSPDDIQAAITLSEPLTDPEPGWIYFGGVDLGLSRDASAVIVVGVHIGRTEFRIIPRRLTSTQQALIDAGIFDEPIDDHQVERVEKPTGRIKVASIRMWKPTSGTKVSVENVEKTIIRLHERFNLSAVGIDPWQAAYLRERLVKAGINAEDVPFTGPNLISMCSATLEAFNERNIDVFDHPQLIHDLRNLRVVEKSYGVRLDSPRGLSGHGDAATALAIALHTLKCANLILHDRCPDGMLIVA
ncbi:MAG: terminase large subunit [Planctomycetales bacterium]